MIGCMPGMGLTPHAAAALQFWLSQGALNPNVHANVLHNLQGSFGQPLCPHFAGAMSMLIPVLPSLCVCCPVSSSAGSLLSVVAAHVLKHVQLWCCRGFTA